MNNESKPCDNFHSANEFCQGCGFLKELHTPAPEDWEEKTRKFMSQFVLHCDQPGDCEGCKADMDVIVEHIASEKAAARREGAERAVEYIEDYVDEALDSNTLSKMNWDALFRDARSEGVSG